MAKSFKKFREECDDEWSYDDDEVRRKERRMEKRRDKRRDKFQEKYSHLDDNYKD
jgi:hypothetical protein